jgi:hypothetical protein
MHWGNFCKTFFGESSEINVLGSFGEEKVLGNFGENKCFVLIWLKHFWANFKKKLVRKKRFGPI